MYKFIEKTKKIMTFLLVAGIAFLTTTSNTKAIANTIVAGDAEDLPAYISTTTFSTKTTQDGKYLYCLEMSKKTTMNTTLTYSGERDAGVAYIIANGYPSKSFTGDAKKDYYITQTAIWWYLDATTGTTNLNNQFKLYGADPYNMRHYVRELFDGACEAKNKGYEKITIDASVDNTKFQMDGDYYVKTVKVSTNADTYTVKLTGKTANTKVVGATSGKTSNTLSSNEDFIIKVPKDEVTKGNLNIGLTITANGVVNKALEYKPADTAMQVVTPAYLIGTEEKVSTKLDLGLSSSKITVTKYDSATKNPLPGAKLVLKDSNGNVITSWTSTTESHVIRNLSDGTYTISEETAPKGYKINTEDVKFTIDSNNYDIKVNFYNDPSEETVINITKIDSETGKPLAGAVMVIKDSEGNEVQRFTTTTETYVITGLAYGNYTLSEISAPEGYKKSDEVLNITLDDEHISYQIKYANYKEYHVPQTNASSLIFMVIGFAIIGSGLGFVIKRAKQTK